MSIEGHSLIIEKEKGYALYEVCMIKKYVLTERISTTCSLQTLLEYSSFILVGNLIYCQLVIHPCFVFIPSDFIKC